MNMCFSDGLKPIATRPPLVMGCRHDWQIHQRSNVIQQDFMGYPLRLFMLKCTKCSESRQEWIDVAENQLAELETGKSVLLKWE